MFCKCYSTEHSTDLHEGPAIPGLGDEFRVAQDGVLADGLDQRRPRERRAGRHPHAAVRHQPCSAIVIVSEPKPCGKVIDTALPSGCNHCALFETKLDQRLQRLMLHS